MKQRSKRVLAGTAATAVILAAGLAAIYCYTPDVRRPGYVEGAPLLEPGDKPFVDTQVGLRFQPPSDWGMQVRSLEAPGTHSAERRIVKYKRLVRGPNVAWLRVIVSDAVGDPTPAEVLKKRKPPEAGWTVTKEVEEGLKIGGRPAARITFGGELDPDLKGPRQCSCEVVAIRRGSQSFVFAGTFTAGDDKAQKEIRDAVESATFDADRPAAKP
jgi:hypothetical protein